jgi:cytochrome bd-type quinol oxidase subunit 2
MDTLQTYLPDYFFLSLGLILFLYMATDATTWGWGSSRLRPPGGRAGPHDPLDRLHLAREPDLARHPRRPSLRRLSVVYGVAMSALYVPVMLMLAGLAFRVWRSSSTTNRRTAPAGASPSGWGASSQPLPRVHPGGLLSGMPVVERQFSGGFGDWFNPSRPLSPRGGGRLRPARHDVPGHETDGELRERAMKTAAMAAWAVLAGLAVTCCG